MKRNKTLGHYFFMNSVLVILLTLLIYGITLWIGKTAFDRLFMLNLKWKGIEAEEAYTYPFENINTKSIEALGGWIEILDENWKVVYVKGEKQDAVYQYDEYQLLDASAALHKASDQYPYIYNVYPVKGPQNRQYVYIVKFPKTLYHVSVTANLTSLFQHPNALQIGLVLSLAGIFLILFLIIMRICNRYTARHINTPLKHLIQGIHAMEAHNYNYRMDFQAEKEFACIRDSFNTMAGRLEAAENEKRAIEKSRQRLLTDISHDLKTPITSIMGYSKLLYEEQTSGDEDKERYLGYIYRKSIYLTQLIEELFEIARLEDEGFQLNCQSGDMAEWLRQVVSEVYPEFEDKSMELQIDISEQPVILEFDQRQMKRAVLNLLYNALKYNPDNTKIRIELHREANGAVLRILDNGTGIQKELKDRIFEPFVCREEAEDNGTGLGLAITRKIIERHNGKIELSSEDNFVTVFQIYLP